MVTSRSCGGIGGRTGVSDILTEAEGHLLLPIPESRTEVQSFTQRAYEDYNHGAPRLDHLNILIRLNFLNAILRNAALVGFIAEGPC